MVLKLEEKKFLLDNIAKYNTSVDVVDCISLFKKILSMDNAELNKEVVIESYKIYSNLTVLILKALLYVNPNYEDFFGVLNDKTKLISNDVNEILNEKLDEEALRIMQFEEGRAGVSLSIQGSFSYISSFNFRIPYFVDSLNITGTLILNQDMILEDGVKNIFFRDFSPHRLVLPQSVNFFYMKSGSLETLQVPSEMDSIEINDASNLEGVTIYSADKFFLKNCKHLTSVTVMSNCEKGWIKDCFNLSNLDIHGNIRLLDLISMHTSNEVSINSKVTTLKLRHCKFAKLIVDCRFVVINNCEIGELIQGENLEEIIIKNTEIRYKNQSIINKITNLLTKIFRLNFFRRSK